jgi:DNA-binding transcriptional LysR family regulator
MDVTLRQLRYFLAVAERESFTAAAEVLLVAQPTVSQAVKELEREVRFPLFEQAGRRVRLTEAGRLLRRHADRILGEVDAIESSMSELWGGHAGRLVVGASSTPGTYLLPPVLGRLREDSPRVEVVLEIADTGEVLQRLQEGRLDLGVVGEAKFPSGIHALPLTEERLLLILSPAHALAAKRWVTPADLFDQPWIMRETGSSTREVIRRALAGQGVDCRVVMELGSTEAIKKAVAAGLGLAFVSEHAVELEQQAGVLAARDVLDLDLRRGFHLVRRAGMPLTRLHERFVETLLGCYAPTGRE